VIMGGRQTGNHEKASLYGVSSRIWGSAQTVHYGKTPTEYRREGGGDEEIFSRKSFTAALLGELEEENDWGLPVTSEGKMEERKRKYAAALHSVVQ